MPLPVDQRTMMRMTLDEATRPFSATRMKKKADSMLRGGAQSSAEVQLQPPKRRAAGAVPRSHLDITRQYSHTARGVSPSLRHW